MYLADKMLRSCLGRFALGNRFLPRLQCNHVCTSAVRPGKKNLDDDLLFEFEKTRPKKDTSAKSPIVNKEAGTFLAKAREELTPDHLKLISYLRNDASIKKASDVNNYDAPKVTSKSISPLAQIFESDSKECLSKALFDSKRYGMTYQEFLMEEAYQTGLLTEQPGRREFDRNGKKEEVFKDFASALKYKKAISHSTLSYVMQKGANKNRKRWKLKKKVISQPVSVPIEKADVPQKIVRRISVAKVTKFSRQNLINAMQFGQPLVFDCRFDKKHNTKPGKAKAQLLRSFNENKYYANPFHFVYCNVEPEDKLINDIQQRSPEMEFCTFTEKSYLQMDELLPREDLIYLSPDSTTVMEKFHADKIYIIGSMVDQPEARRLTRSLADLEGVKCQSLPLDKYLMWGSITGRKALTICSVVQILCTLKQTGSWIEAFKNIPLRFHTGLTPYAKSLIEHDPDTIERFNYAMIRNQIHFDNVPRKAIRKQREDVSKYFGRF